MENLDAVSWFMGWLFYALMLDPKAKEENKFLIWVMWFGGFICFLVK